MGVRARSRTGPARPRRGLRTTPFQPREPVFWLFTAVVLGAGAATVREQHRLFAGSPAGWWLAWALLGGCLAAAFAGLRGLDRYDRQPLSVAAGALLWGLLAAPALAAVADRAWSSLLDGVTGADLAGRWAPAFTGPVVEEPVKALGLVLLYLSARDRHGGLVDGFVAGAVVGLGFAAAEASGYLLAEDDGSPAGVLHAFTGRVLVDGLGGHVVSAGLLGVAVALAVTRRRIRPGSAPGAGPGSGPGALAPVGLCLLAVLAHAGWHAPVPDLPVPLLSQLLKAVPFLAVLVLILLRADRDERERVAAGLSAELGRPGIMADEVPVLLSRRLRRRERGELRTRAGRRHLAALRRLRQEQLRLAEAAARLPDPDSPERVCQREMCRSLRDSLAVTSGLAGAWSRQKVVN